MSDPFVTLWAVACLAPLSVEFSRQEYWSRLPFPPPGHSLDPRIEPASLALAGDSLSLRHQGSPLIYIINYQFSVSMSNPHATSFSEILGYCRGLYSKNIIAKNFVIFFQAYNISI